MEDKQYFYAHSKTGRDTQKLCIQNSLELKGIQTVQQIADILAKYNDGNEYWYFTLSPDRDDY